MKIRGQQVHTPEQRILRMIERVGECWEWKGSVRGGYGRLIVGSPNGANQRSHSRLQSATGGEVMKPCPCCRGYALEARWCHVCGGAGYIRGWIIPEPQAIGAESISKWQPLPAAPEVKYESN